MDSGVTAMSEVALAAADIASKVDCITNLTDNTVVSALQTVLDEADKAGIPVFGSEVEQVKAGCVASMGLEYIELGKQTGKMAARVLKGEAEASELNFEVIFRAQPVCELCSSREDQSGTSRELQDRCLPVL